MTTTRVQHRATGDGFRASWMRVPLHTTLTRVRVRRDAGLGALFGALFGAYFGALIGSRSATRLGSRFGSRLGSGLGSGLGSRLGGFAALVVLFAGTAWAANPETGVPEPAPLVPEVRSPAATQPPAVRSENATVQTRRDASRGAGAGRAKPVAAKDVKPTAVSGKTPVRTDKAKTAAAERQTAARVARQTSTRDAAPKKRPMAGAQATRRAAPLSPKAAPVEPFPATSLLKCQRKEPGGYHETADVRLSGRHVDAMKWRVVAGRSGECSFDLAAFEQVSGQDQIELRSRQKDSCRLLMWRRGNRVTLSANDCDQRCGEAVSERIWPISFDARNGQCAR